MGANLCLRPAVELAILMKNERLSPVRVVDEHLKRIQRLNDDLNAYVTVFEDDARQQALEAEQAIENGEPLGPLHGVPVALKDIGYRLQGRTLTSGVAPLSDTTADNNSITVQRLKEAGAIFLGQTNTPEFGYKATTENPLFGPTSTPFCLDRNAGGSSGGSASAAAAGLAPITMGGDGGGSVRNPAAWCGVFGFKPSFGRIPRDSRPNGFLKHTPFADPGPITRSVADAALVLDVVGGPHPRDPFSMPDEGVDYLAAIQRDVRDVRIAYSPNFEVFPVSEEVETVVSDAVSGFEEVAAAVDEVSLNIPDSHQELTNVWLQYVAVVYATVSRALYENEDIDLVGTHRNELSDDFVSLIEMGEELDAVEYRTLDVARTQFLDAIQNCLDEYDLILTPTLAVPPVENTSDNSTSGPSVVNGERVDPRIGWCLTYPVNFSGNPAASVPGGLTDDGLPVGVQLIGRRFDDETVLATAAAFERVRPWVDSLPGT